jgi:hypothetical protein
VLEWRTGYWYPQLVDGLENGVLVPLVSGWVGVENGVLVPSVSGRFGVENGVLVPFVDGLDCTLIPQHLGGLLGTGTLRLVLFDQSILVLVPQQRCAGKDLGVGFGIFTSRNLQSW